MTETTQLPQDVIAAIEAKQLIRAVTLLRKETGCDLLEAKQLIEAYIDEHPAAIPESMGTPSLQPEPAINRVALIVVVAVVAAVVYLFAQ
jgi:hypothetical protein